MGFFSSLREFFTGKSDAERVRDLAHEVERYADRFENSGDSQNAAVARDYAERIRGSRTLRAARELYEEFLAMIEKYAAEDPRDRRGIRDDELEETDDDSDTDDDWSDDS